MRSTLPYTGSASPALEPFGDLSQALCAAKRAHPPGRRATGRIAAGAIEARTDEALLRTGLRDLARAALGDLSGGERQRVAIARAIAQQAQYAVLDEPLNQLDLRHRLELMHTLRAIAPTLVIALHDLELAARWCDHLVLLHHGRVHATGVPAAV